MVRHIRHSFVTNTPKGDVPYFPFLLDESFADQPSKFDIDFIIDGVRYHYGFTCNSKRFIDEWLYAFPSGNRQSWFSRTDTKDFYFGKNLKGKNRSIEEFTRGNSLFLSTAAQNAHQQLTPIYEYFSKNIVFDLSASVSTMDVEMRNDSSIDPRIVEFLRLADTGIAGVKLDEIRLGEDDQSRRMLSDLQELMINNLGPSAPDLLKDGPSHRLRFSHYGKGALSVFLDIHNESRGTLRLFKLLDPIVGAFDRAKVIVVDELDASLHTLLAMKLVEMFGSVSLNKLGSQLIATTHDTNLLCMESLRRDQIWFAEKSREGSTSAYPLTDIRTRQEDNLEKGYLQGRFGAVPFLGSIDRLLGNGDQLSTPAVEISDG
jgi:hypothetical protein